MNARLLSVNAWLPRDVPWNGTVVRTGIWKQAVAGPRRVHRLNIDGDGQGDTDAHGGEHRAVLVYQMESYRYWEDYFGRRDFTYGQFGENFTVAGLPDDEVCIGDRFRIGGAEFEVTQPRVTCYRVGLRLGEPRMAALLVSHRRPGFYLRVLAEGDVQAGDEIVKIGTGAPAVTVAGIDALLYLPGRGRADLERAVSIPALSAGWRESLRAMLASDGVARHSAARDGASGLGDWWKGFQPLAVASVEPETATVVSVRLAAPPGRVLPEPRPGQYVTIKAPVGDGAGQIRSYSLSSAPGDPQYRISVKREPGGTVSGYIHDAVTAGQTLEVARPRGEFVLGEGSGPVLLASAGIGVTPVLAMLHDIAARQPGRCVVWLQVARSPEDRPLDGETDRLLAALPNARAHLFYTSAHSSLPADRLWASVHRGRPALAALRALGLPPAAEAYLCGPVAFISALRAQLSVIGFRTASIHAEIFGGKPAVTPGVVAAGAASPHQPPGPPGPGPQISFARSGLTVRWSDNYASLLELAEACAAPVRWACRAGVCHSCQTALINGQVRYGPQPLEPPAEGSTLLCCSQPQTGLVLDL